jgi:hypothetical protein
MKKVLNLSDCHHPFVDKIAWRLFLKAARECGPWDECVINGDFADCLAVSFHPKTPGRKYVIADEIAAVNKALDELQDAVGKKCYIVYLGGNHENRMDRYIAEKAKELHGLEGTTIPGLLRLRERGIHWIPYKAAAYKVGKLAFIHDLGRCGVNTARQSLQDYGSNVVVGHSHRAGIVYQGTVRGESHVGVNSGWLGDAAAADYMHVDKARRDWQKGFVVAYVENNGNAHVQFVPVIGRSCVVDGKLIRL